jgi:hypothetical protein
VLRETEQSPQVFEGRHSHQSPQASRDEHGMFSLKQIGEHSGDENKKKYEHSDAESLPSNTTIADEQDN